MKNDIVEVIAWNTGCWYTSAGQRIAAARYEDGTIQFLDIDRNIGGVLHRKMPWSLCREQVHRAYLENAYDDVWPSDDSDDMWPYLSQFALEVEPLKD